MTFELSLIFANVRNKSTEAIITSMLVQYYVKNSAHLEPVACNRKISRNQNKAVHRNNGETLYDIQNIFAKIRQFDILRHCQISINMKAQYHIIDTIRNSSKLEFRCLTPCFPEFPSFLLIVSPPFQHYT